jgi:hypothetical protein
MTNEPTTTTTTTTTTIGGADRRPTAPIGSMNATSWLPSGPWGLPLRLVGPSLREMMRPNVPLMLTKFQQIRVTA